MESKAKLFGHPVHQMLIVFPLGLLGMSAIFDLVQVVRRGGNWHETAYPMIGAGIAGGLTAAVFGLVDWLAIPKGTRAKQIGLLHAGANVVALLLFGLSWLMRRDDPARPENAALAASFAGMGVSLLGGWLGGELVDRLGVGVDKGAHLNASNSLTGKPADDRDLPSGTAPV